MHVPSAADCDRFFALRPFMGKQAKTKLMLRFLAVDASAASVCLVPR
jgi:hypothetical protein